MQRMVANETVPGSFCCLSWQSVPWLVLPALELMGCQAPCACVCVCVHCCACVWFGLSKLSRDKCLGDPGLEFQPVFLYTRCWLWEARSEPTILGIFFFRSLFFFLLQPMGLQLWSFISKALAGQWHFFKRAKGLITHSVCVSVGCFLL